MLYVPGFGFIDLWWSLFISLLCAGVGAAIAVRKNVFLLDGLYGDSLCLLSAQSS